MANAQEVRNDKRRSDYGSDAAYRRACTEASRNKYRRDKNVVLSTCLDNIDKVASFGNLREVTIGSTVGNKLCFTVKELADILGYTPTNLYRWQSRDMFPEPIARAKIAMYSKSRGEIYESTQKVFLEGEVKVIVEVIGEHQSKLCYYRQSDTETTKKLYSAVGAVRRTYEG